MLKIFCVYHKPYHLFSSDVFEPIQTGCAEASEDLKILRDDTGDNISHKNKNYGELSAWYWVWKNYLPLYPETEYIGFCHYRRFLNFDKAPPSRKSFHNVITDVEFKEQYFKKYSLERICETIRGFDVILPGKYFFGRKDKSIYHQYVTSGHPKLEIDKLCSIIKAIYPDYERDMEEYLSGRSSYLCLNYVMKKELFEKFMTWVFRLLDEMEKISDWSQYNEYSNQRTPAYLMERFFNVWLNHQIRVNHIKILEREGILISSFLQPIEIKKHFFFGITLIKAYEKRILKIFGLKIRLKDLYP